VYYGFVVLDDITAKGYTLGKMTDFGAEPCDEGGAFVGRTEVGPVWFGRFATLRTSKRSCPSKQTGGECGASVSVCQ
jgi:hypothetical protein